MKFVSVIICLAVVDASQPKVRRSPDKVAEMTGIDREVAPRAMIIEADGAEVLASARKASERLGIPMEDATLATARVTAESSYKNQLTCIAVTNVTQRKVEGKKAKSAARKHYEAIAEWLKPWVEDRAEQRQKTEMDACDASYCVVMNKLASYIQDENSWRLFRDSDAEIAADKFESEHPCETAKANAQKDGKEITASIVGKPGLLRSVFFFI